MICHVCFRILPPGYQFDMLQMAGRPRILCRAGDLDGCRGEAAL